MALPHFSFCFLWEFLHLFDVRFLISQFFLLPQLHSSRECLREQLMFDSFWISVDRVHRYILYKGQTFTEVNSREYFLEGGTVLFKKEKKRTLPLTFNDRWFDPRYWIANETFSAELIRNCPNLAYNVMIPLRI